MRKCGTVRESRWLAMFSIAFAVLWLAGCDDLAFRIYDPCRGLIEKACGCPEVQKRREMWDCWLAKDFAIDQARGRYGYRGCLKEFNTFTCSKL